MNKQSSLEEPESQIKNEAESTTNCHQFLHKSWQYYACKSTGERKFMGGFGGRPEEDLNMAQLNAPTIPHPTSGLPTERSIGRGRQDAGYGRVYG